MLRPSAPDAAPLWSRVSRIWYLGADRLPPRGKLDLGHSGPVCQEVGEAPPKKRDLPSRCVAQHRTGRHSRIPRRPDFEESQREMGKDFGVCVNPEFMREGTAVADFLEPAITVIGAADSARSQILREVYANVAGHVFQTSFRSAEMVKYVCNTWHAVKVAFHWLHGFGTQHRRDGILLRVRPGM